MKKNKVLFLSLLLGLFFPLVVNAANANTEVGKDLSLYQCTSSKYQDNNISTSSKAYFSHCMEATCSNWKYNIKYYSNKKVICLNGNNDPYVKVEKNGCSDYENKVCSNRDVKYCSKLISYDCGRKSDGSTFATTTKYIPRPSSIVTTTTTTVIIDSRLSSLTLSNGTIDFNPDVFEYAITVQSDVNSISVNAVPIDSSSQISVTGNENIVDGSVISVTVKTIDDKATIYNIKVNKEAVVLSNNTRLKSLIIAGYDLNFGVRITNYSLTIDKDTSFLDISYETEDVKSNVEIIGNENLQNGSKITVKVTAEDGSVGNYYIDILMKKESNFLLILFIIIVIIALGAGGFYVYKKLFAGKSGEKYEYE